MMVFRTVKYSKVKFMYWRDNILILLMGIILALIMAIVPLVCAARKMPSETVKSGGVLAKYFYYSADLGDGKNIAKLEEVWQRALKAGYAKVVLADGKFDTMDLQSPEYFQNVLRVKKIAQQLNFEVIPAIFSIGYSALLLAHNPNLAEAVPVRNVPYVVRNGVANIDSADQPSLANGNFRSLEGWINISNVLLDHGTVKVMPVAPESRLSQAIKVKPFRQYHLTLRIRTENFRGITHVALMSGWWWRRSLNANEPVVQSNQDWTSYEIVFNSLDYDTVLLALVVDGTGRKGFLWFKDVKVEEIGFLNITRRDNTPIIVQNERGQVLEEGKDFKPVNDPKSMSGWWEKPYHVPPILETSLPEGTRLRVSYYHSLAVRPGEVMICPSEKKTRELLKRVFEKVHEVWGAKSYFMQHDEIRVLGWDPACVGSGKTTGQILADNLKACTRIIKTECPDCQIYVWSDMFDPFHNAVRKNYYLVKDGLPGSWEGLDKNVIVANWNSGHAADSLRFFQKKGNKQIIAGYYDKLPGEFPLWCDQLNKDSRNVVGIMYTTWQKKYDDLSNFSSEIHDHVVGN